MRRIQIHLEKSMDDELATQARHGGLSKAALIRRLLRDSLDQTNEDPIDAVIGAGDGQPAPNIDEVVYGR